MCSHKPFYVNHIKKNTYNHHYFPKITLKNIVPYWSIISRLGIKKTMPFYLQKHIILGNQINFGVFWILWVYILIDFMIVQNPSRVLLGLGIIIVIGIPLLLNVLQLTTFSRVFAAGFFSVTILSLIITVKFLGQPPQLLFYIIPRFGLLCCIVLPFLLLDSRYERPLFIFCNILNISCIVFFDPLHSLFGVSFQQLGGSVSFYPIITANSMVLMIVMILAFTFFKNLTTHYEQELIQINTTLDQKNQEIMCQNEELNQQQEQILRVNNQLEELIAQRTQKLIIRNHQLSEYAFLNSHKLRAPIATLLGLYQVLNLSKNSEEQDLILHKIKVTIELLDAIVHEMQKLLDEQDILDVEE